MSRRPVLAVIGSGDAVPEVLGVAEVLGAAAVTAGFRVVTGGRGGVMAAASRGARTCPAWTDGSVPGILPGEDAAEANEWVDIALPTGLGIARNVLVVRAADVVVAVAGGSGTLSEIALAWQLGRPVLALPSCGGWAEQRAGRALDDRRGDRIHPARTPAEAVSLAQLLLSSASSV